MILQIRKNNGATSSNKYEMLLHIIIYKFQIILLEESWHDLLILSLAQWDVPLEVHHVLECANISQDSLASDKMAAILSDIRFIRDVLTRFKHLTVDRTEYACLKAIVLFRPGTLNFILLQKGH